VTRIIRKPPPLRRQSDPQKGDSGFAWNSTTQEFIEILPEDHPDYRQNQEIIRAAIDRWNAGISKK
jgi:hypothetical protein